ncbi:histidine phosphatase family protein [Neisseria leonii]|uniref:SixA phosphatase family protein n=1 Tax=Neisseria leonii TaxID=2995413 RepID=UPI0030D10357
MNLILWRHAQAEYRDGPDLARLLTAHGHRQAEHTARWLRPLLPDGAEIWVSEAARSQQTAVYLNPEYAVSPLLNPDAAPENIMPLLAAAAEKSTVIIVGHQPWIGALCACLLNGGTPAESWPVKKSGVWWFNVKHTPDGLHAKLKAAMTPAVLGI